MKSTKTERTRTISLPASLIQVLKFQRESQDELSRLAGPAYHIDPHLVFPDPQGDYLDPNDVSSKASRIARKAGFPKGVSMHTLRHAHASQLLSNGVSLPTVSKRLGHTDCHTTATIYSHSLPKDDPSAADVWDTNFAKTAEQPAKTKAS